MPMITMAHGEVGSIHQGERVNAVVLCEKSRAAVRRKMFRYLPDDWADVSFRFVRSVKKGDGLMVLAGDRGPVVAIMDQPSSVCVVCLQPDIVVRQVDASQAMGALNPERSALCQ